MDASGLANRDGMKLELKRKQKTDHLLSCTSTSNRRGTIWRPRTSATMARKRRAAVSNLSGEVEKDDSASPPRRTLRNRQTATVQNGNNCEDGSDQSESCESTETEQGSDEEMPKKSEMRTRHQRACAPVNKTNEIEDDDDDDQSSGSKTLSSIDDDGVGSDDDYDEQDTRDAHGEVNDKPRARSSQTKQSLDGRGKKRKIEKPSLKCPHCSKILSSALGLKYHLGKCVYIQNDVSLFCHILLTRHCLCCCR